MAGAGACAFSVRVYPGVGVSPPLSAEATGVGLASGPSQALVSFGVSDEAAACASAPLSASSSSLPPVRRGLRSWAVLIRHLLRWLQNMVPCVLGNLSPRLGALTVVRFSRVSSARHIGPELCLR